MGNGCIIAVENLGKKYCIRHGEREHYVALRDVLARRARDIVFVVGIIGRNGSGKSTLLKILSQITEPRKGRVRIRGRVARLLEVRAGVHPELTGRENIYLNGAILEMTRVRALRDPHSAMRYMLHIRRSAKTTGARLFRAFDGSLS